MFKPTLKRKYLNNETIQDTRKESVGIRKQERQVREVQRVEVSEEKVSIVPTTLLEPPSYVEKPTPMVVSPLSCQQYHYPEQVNAGLNRQLTSSATRSIGYSQAVHWFFLDHELILWNYYPQAKAQVQHTVSRAMTEAIHAVEIGYLRNVGANFSSHEVLLCAVGMATSIELFSVDPTLHLHPLNMKVKIEYGQTLHKLHLLHNILYAVGDAANITTLDLGLQYPVKRTQVHNRGLGALSKDKHISLYAEKLLVGEQRVYVLVRKQNKVSWWSTKYKQMQHFLKGEQWQHYPTMVWHKQIHIYKKVKGGQVKLERVVKQEEIKEKVINSYGYFKQKYKEQTRMKEALEIVSMFLHQAGDENVGVGTKFGYSIVMNGRMSELSFLHEPTPIKLEQLKGQDHVSLFQVVKESGREATNLTYSFGEQSLNLTPHTLLLNLPQQQHVIKIVEEPGHLMQVPPQKDLKWLDPKWIVFTKTSLTFVSRMTVKEILATYLHAKGLLQAKCDHHIYEVQKHFFTKVEHLASIYGKVELCHALYELFSHYAEWKSKAGLKVFAVNSDLRLMADVELKNGSPSHYHQWFYVLGKLTGCEGYEIGQTSGRQLLRIICEYEHQYENKKLMSRNDRESMGSCWWICLREKFYSIISPILEWRPKAFVMRANKQRKQKVVSELEVMLTILELKEAGEKKARNDLMFIHKRISEEQKRKENDLFNMSSFLQKSINKTTFPDMKESPEVQSINYNHVTQSLDSFVATLSTAIPKLLSLISFYQLLAECDKIDSCELPTFHHFIINLKQRQVAKNAFVEYLGVESAEKMSMIRKLDKEVPELCLHHNINFYKWFQQSSLRDTENLNMKYMAKNLNVEMIKKCQNQLYNYPHKYLELLLQRWYVVEAYIKGTEQKMQMNKNIKQKNGDLDNKNSVKNRENERMLKQLEECMVQQQGEVEERINHFIVQYAKATHEAKGIQFQEKEKQFDDMLKLLHQSPNQSFFLKLRSFMKEHQIMMEKIFAYTNNTSQHSLSAISQTTLTQGPDLMDTMTLIRIYEGRYNMNLGKNHNQTASTT